MGKGIQWVLAVTVVAVLVAWGVLSFMTSEFGAQRQHHGPLHSSEDTEHRDSASSTFDLPRDSAPIGTQPADPFRAPGSERSLAMEALRKDANEIVLEGYVRETSGAPLPDSMVELREMMPGPFEHATPGGLVATLSVDAEGAFSARGVLRPGDRYVLRVLHPELALARRTPIDPLVPSTLFQDIRLDAGVTLTGRVTDEAQQPLAMARAAVYDLDQGASQEGICEREQLTDEQGRFNLVGVSFGTKRLVVTGSGLRTAIRAPLVLRPGFPVEQLDFSLPNGVAISGRVEFADTGAAIPGVTLQLRSVAGFTDQGVLGPSGMQATLPRTPSRGESQESLFAMSGPDGAFVFEGLDRRLYHLSVAGDRSQASPALNVSGGADDVVIKLRPDTTISGRVVDAETNKPVTSFAIVPSQIPNPLAIAWAKRRRIDDVEGRFSVSGTAPGTQYLIIEAVGYARGSSVALHVGPGERIDGVEVRLVRGSTLFGRVVDDRGMGIAGARVRLLEERDGPAQGTIEWISPVLRTGRFDVSTFEDGSFALPGIERANYSVTVNHPDHVVHRTDRLVVADTGDVDLGDLVLSKGATLRGTVLQPNGEPDDRAIVMVLAAEGGSEPVQTPTNGDGEFEIRGLKAGVWRVTVLQERGELRLERITELRNGGGHPTTLRAGASKTVELREER